MVVPTDSSNAGLQVSGWAGSHHGPAGLSLTSYLVHTNVADVSTTRFDSFDRAERNILNDIKHITLYAQKSNYHSIPTDCPTRERRSEALSRVVTLLP